VLCGAAGTTQHAGIKTAAAVGLAHGKHSYALQAQAAGVMSGGSSGGKKAAESNEFWWDVAGWVTLGAIIVGVMMFSRGSTPAPVKA